MFAMACRHLELSHSGVSSRSWSSCRAHPTAAVIASDTAKAYVKCGGAAYWAIALALVPVTGAVSAGAAAWLTRKHNLKAAAGRSLRKGEVRMGPRV